MQSLLKVFFTLSLVFFWGFQAFAGEYLPKGCLPLALKAANIELKAESHGLFFLHNISNYHIWLANPAQPKWTVEIKPGLWNVWYLKQDTSEWRCIQSEKGHEQQVSCQDVIAVCQWPVQVPEHLEIKLGGWLIENQSIVVAKAYLQRMGWLFVRPAPK